MLTDEILAKLGQQTHLDDFDKLVQEEETNLPVLQKIVEYAQQMYV